MQTKTIRKTIITKLNEWLETIEDEKLRSDVKKEILVSGGSIASMFLKEDVNDYDIYLKTPETLKRLVDYYLKDFPELQSYLGKDKDKLLQEYFPDVVKVVNDEEITSAGRIFFENLKEDQVKIWCNKESNKIVENVEEGLLKYKPKYFSSNAISLTDKIQIVLRFTGNNEEIHKNFDFIHATNYFTFADGLVTNTKALESLLTKQLSYQGSLYPVTSILRAKKFIKRGWNIGAGEYLKIMFQISQLDLTDFNVLEEQLSGVDVAYFQLLVDLLRDKKSKDPKFELTYEFLCSLLVKIFDDDEKSE